MKKLEDEGYLYEGAEASFEILLKKSIGKHRTFFDLVPLPPSPCPAHRRLCPLLRASSLLVARR
ncbi:MAG: hypothetical protein HY900_38240 [Deltaproteobacteria bacterium]|nr:hypothetical protein [Deltaproteobacteria bacterium]